MHEVELLDAVVVVARQRDAVLTRDAREIGELLVAELGRRLGIGRHGGGLLLGEVLAAERPAPDLEVAVLPLAGRMVHEGQLVDLAGAQVPLDLVDQVHVVDLQTQVQAVADEVGVAPLGALRAADEVHELLGAVPLAHRLDVHLVGAVDRKRVEHRRDAVGEQLALRLEQSGREVHEHGRARGDDRLDVVGVDVDEAGHDVAAVRVDDAGAALLGIEDALALDRRDAVALHHELVAEQQPVGLHDDAVANDVQGTTSLDCVVLFGTGSKKVRGPSGAGPTSWDGVKRSQAERRQGPSGTGTGQRDREGPPAGRAVRPTGPSPPAGRTRAPRRPATAASTPAPGYTRAAGPA